MKCPPIKKAGEAEPAAKPADPPAEEDVAVRVGGFPACVTSIPDLD
ncbi:MAG: hypothetical protein LBU23_11950 [Planctomycetota bacterium]|nr:hypothetical protein [Planctomycetota bacterium]